MPFCDFIYEMTLV